MIQHIALGTDRRGTTYDLQGLWAGYGEGITQENPGPKVFAACKCDGKRSNSLTDCVPRISEFRPKEIPAASYPPSARPILAANDLCISGVGGHPRAKHA
jgi:hypothetical protein